MQIPDLYPQAAVVSGILLIAVFGWHFAWAIREYRRYHDDRSARALLVAMLLLFTACGLELSALGFFEGHPPVLPTIGLGILRGALLVGGVTLLLMDREAGHDG